MTFRESHSQPADAEAQNIALRELHRTLMLGSLTGGLGHELLNLLMPVLLRADVLEASPTIAPEVRADVSALRHTLAPIRHLAEGLRVLSSDPFSEDGEARVTTLADWWLLFRGLLASTLPSTAIIDARFDPACAQLPLPTSVLTHTLLTLVGEGRRLVDTGNRETWRVVTDTMDSTPRLTLTLHSNSPSAPRAFATRGSDVFDVLPPQEMAAAGEHAARQRLRDFGASIATQYTAISFAAELLFPEYEAIAGEANLRAARTNISESHDDATSFSVLCIDDNVSLVDALERRLGLEPGFRSLSRVRDFSLSAETVIATHPSVVLLDINLPNGVDALEILADIVARNPTTRVIVFTGHPTEDLISRAMTIGARGFISKGAPADRVIAAIHRVLNGHAVIEGDD